MQISGNLTIGGDLSTRSVTADEFNTLSGISTANTIETRLRVLESSFLDMEVRGDYDETDNSHESPACDGDGEILTGGVTALAQI